MPGRHGEADNSDYRYGYQGSEKDDEIKGKGNSINYKYRMHDPRLGRFFAVDPLYKRYPHNSPYAFSENRVIDGVELEGLEYHTFHIKIDKEGNRSLLKIESHRDNTKKGYGKLGEGIAYKYTYSVGGEEFSSTVFEKNSHGIYQGSNNPEKRWEKQDGDGNYPGFYEFAPIDEIDKAAKEHDLDYDKVHAVGFSGVLDEKTIEADNEYMKKAKIVLSKQENGEKDAVTGKLITHSTSTAASNGYNFFKIMSYFKSGPKTTAKRKAKQHARNKRAYDNDQMGIGPKY